MILGYGMYLIPFMLGSWHHWRSTFREVSHSLDNHCILNCHEVWFTSILLMEEILHLTSKHGFSSIHQQSYLWVIQPTCLTSVWSHELCFCLGIPGHFWKSKDQSLTWATSRGVTILCWWNQAKMWQQMKSYFSHLQIENPLNCSRCSLE